MRGSSTKKPGLIYRPGGDSLNAQRGIDRAWEQFLCKGSQAKDLPIRDVIASSWERCLSQGVNPEQKAAPLLVSENTLSHHRLRNSDLLLCAEPVLEQARLFLQDLETILYLTDYQGLNLQIVGDPRTIDDARDIGLVEGSGWNEGHSGSNAVGTAMATRKPTQVHGEEHYIQGFKPWTCTAAVIADPYDNQMMGVIDLSGLCSIYDKFHVPLVVAWASQIQSGLAKKTSDLWSLIIEHSNSQFGHYRNTGKLLLDKQGRLINSTANAAAALDSLGIDYDPETKRRLSMQRFGGDEIVYPHDAGLWVSEDWVEPILHKGNIVGFQVLVPSPRRSAAKPTAEPLAASPAGSLDPFDDIYGKSPSFQASADKARKAANTPLPVLILGDTGVGKEVFAKAIHDSSQYADGPFIDLNCGGFTRDILSSELFGHVEGAFTGARKGGMMGKIEAANGGTLFLDEIGELPLELQPVFLRVLQEKKIYRVGDIKPIPVDFRLIAATNRDLKGAVNEGLFRKDLYFRLSTVTISLDPLSGRKEDIEGIAQLVMARIRKTDDISAKRFSPGLMTALKSREWPGNIRELANVVECMCFMSTNETLTIDDLPEGYRPGESNLEPEHVNAFITPPQGNLDRVEKSTIEAAIKQAEGNMTQAAKHLGIAKSTLYQKMKKYHLKKPT
ncbi:MAG: transcriptional regulator of acetoin/glycerol metabolism [Porticoccus sp.]|uniref:sigma-54-dependent Fis family transcriptional regulator n=1 Tax=Porticoccus sp. TaxID=2024853 RepID=UPI0039E5B3C3